MSIPPKRIILKYKKSYFQEKYLENLKIDSILKQIS